MDQPQPGSLSPRMSTNSNIQAEDMVHAPWVTCYHPWSGQILKNTSYVGQSRVLDSANLSSHPFTSTPPYDLHSYLAETPAALSLLVCIAFCIALSDWNVFPVISQLLQIRKGFLEEVSPWISLEGWAVSPFSCLTPIHPSKTVHIASPQESLPWLPSPQARLDAVAGNILPWVFLVWGWDVF